MSDGYAGDVTPKQAWDMLTSNASAQLVDVRTIPEFNFVGVPDLSGIGKKCHGIPWKNFPVMNENPDFTDAVEILAPERDTPLLFLCRSGVRSISAAQAITARGYSKAYNVLCGFEGDKDAAGHRGTVGGWKVDGLPWKQG
ncbi:MAG: rhodanese-like domain-containing protein [Rhodospirillaceae bacterium]